jgi:hypothetical protein
MTSAAGEDVLLLDVIWDGYRFLQRDVVRRWGNIKIAHFDPFISHLHDHPISNPDSSDRSLLKSIGDCFRTFSPSDYTSSRQRLLMTVEIPVRSKKRIAEDNESRQQPVKRSRKTVVFAQTQQEGYDKLLEFINELYGLIDPSVPPESEWTSLMRRVANSPDEYLPFREHAPSRAKVKESGGPFDPDFLRTMHGLFSILLWRGITFGCAFVIDHPTNRFTSLEEFLAVVEGNHDKDPSYFCKMNIYTTPIAGRSIELAADYWEAAQLEADNWVNLVNSANLTYTDLFKFFTKNKDSAPVVPTKYKKSRTRPYRYQSSSFPQIGSLIGHLMAADCHYSFLPDPLPASDLGDMICTLDMGALNGMRKLGLIAAGTTGNAHSRGEIREAFEGAYEFLRANLPPDCQAVMGFNSLMVEHSFCKYSKLHRSSRDVGGRKAKDD